MSTFEEKVQARMNTIRAQKEQDAIEIEARRRLNVEKIANKKRNKITGLTAKIARLESDISLEAYAYKRVMTYMNYLAPEERSIMYYHILNDIKTTHDGYLEVLAAKRELLRSLE
jgi:hypothetical protein